MQHFLAQTTTTTDNSGAAAAAMMAGMGVGVFIFIVIAIAISIAIYYVIIKKTGYNPWLSLLVLIPGLGQLIILIMLVFTEWPIEREVKALRAGAGAYPGGGTAYAPGTTITPQ